MLSGIWTGNLDVIKYCIKTNDKQITKNTLIDFETVTLCLQYINDKKANPVTLVFNINAFNEVS